MRDTFHTRAGYRVTLNNVDCKWNRLDFTYLGIIHLPSGDVAWAWHADGSSIDRLDNDFGLVDFPKPDVGEAWRCLADAA